MTVTRMRFDCPETAEPLASMLDFGQWPGRDDELVSLHCPKCSRLHSFRQAEAILAIEPGERTLATAAPPEG